MRYMPLVLSKYKISVDTERLIMHSWKNSVNGIVGTEMLWLYEIYFCTFEKYKEQS